MNNEYYVEKTALIHCPPEYIFKVLTEVKYWNQWTKSINEICIIDNDTLRVGAKIKVYQPRLRPAVWTISEISENKILVWKKKSPGLKMTANHFLEQTSIGTIVRLQVVYRGFLSKVFYRLTSSLTETYLKMEVSGLKQKCEEMIKTDAYSNEGFNRIH